MDDRDREYEPECLQEFSSMTTEECQVARENRESIKQHGAESILIRESDSAPNRIEIWAYTDEELQNAVEYYIALCGND